MVHDEYIRVARKLVETGMPPDTVVLVDRLQEFFPNQPELVEAEPFSLGVLASQPITEWPVRASRPSAFATARIRASRHSPGSRASGAGGRYPEHLGGSVAEGGERARPGASEWPRRGGGAIRDCRATRSGPCYFATGVIVRLRYCTAP